MAEHVTGLTEFVNHYLGRYALALLSALHSAGKSRHAHSGARRDGVVVLIIGTLLALLLRSRLSVEKPCAAQQIAELLLTNPLGFVSRIFSKRMSITARSS